MLEQALLRRCTHRVMEQRGGDADEQGGDAVATADTEAVARPTDAAGAAGEAATADDTPAAEVVGVAEDEEPRAPEKKLEM